MTKVLLAITRINNSPNLGVFQTYFIKRQAKFEFSEAARQSWRSGMGRNVDRQCSVKGQSRLNLASVLGIGVNLIGPTYRGLYNGTWDHDVRPNKAKPL